MNHLGVLLRESGILGHLLLNDRNHARECVHDISCSISDLLKSFALFPSSLSLCSLCLRLALLFSPAVGYGLLPAVGYALVLPAVGYALPVLLIILQKVDVLLAQSSCPCCFLFSSHHWLFGSGSVSVALQSLQRSGRLVDCPRCTGGLQHHCAILWALSTLKTKAFIAAFCHGVVLWFVRHRWLVVDPRVSLSSLRDSLTISVVYLL